MSTRIFLSKPLFYLFALLLLSSCSKRKTGYVDMFRLVSEFELQKEFSAEAKMLTDRAKTSVDSLVYTVKLQDPAGAQQLQTELYTELLQKTEERNKQIEATIWKRLNPYVEEYGKEKGYTYIYGANGNGQCVVRRQGRRYYG